MKKKVCSIVMSFILFITLFAQTSLASDGLQDLYKHILNQYISEWGGENIGYTLFDIDNNGLKELIVDFGGSDGSRAYGYNNGIIQEYGYCAGNTKGYYQKNNNLYVMCFALSKVETENVTFKMWIDKIILNNNEILHETIYYNPSYRKSLDELDQDTEKNIPEVAIFLNGAEEIDFLNIRNQSLLEDLIQIDVKLNGNPLSFDQPPIIQNGRTLVPLRAIFEAMGATVDWDGDTQTVISTLFGTTVKLTIGSNILYRNDEAKTLDVPAQIVNNYTMVPARAVAEAFGANVDWDGDTQTVYITTSGNNYTVNTVPEIIFDGFNSNFADFNGMYIDSFSHYTNSNGSENVKFDVYNTNYIYGVVEVFERNGKLSDVAIIDKMSNSTSIKGVLIDDTGKLIKDLFTGNVLTYKQESGYSKKTSISIDIPKGGYIKITNDMSESLVASLINLSDMVLNAKKTYSSLKGFNSETSKEYAQELSLKLIKDVAFSEMLNNPTTYSDDLWKGVADKLYMNSESIGGFIDTISKNLDELADGEFTELMLSTAGNCGISVAEGTFEALAGPAGVALKGMFALTSATDAIMEMNDGVNCMYQGSIKIQDAK